MELYVKWIFFTKCLDRHHAVAECRNRDSAAAILPAAVWITAVSTCLGRRKPENSCGSRKIAASGTQKNVMRSLRKRADFFGRFMGITSYTIFYYNAHARSMRT